jgi:hypothetical protein
MRKLGLLEAAQFSEQEYINELFVAVHLGICAAITLPNLRLEFFPHNLGSRILDTGNGSSPEENNMLKGQ